jgi:hypothetical protein
MRLNSIGRGLAGSGFWKMGRASRFKEGAKRLAVGCGVLLILSGGCPGLTRTFGADPSSIPAAVNRTVPRVELPKGFGKFVVPSMVLWEVGHEAAMARKVGLAERSLVAERLPRGSGKALVEKAAWFA